MMTLLKLLKIKATWSTWRGHRGHTSVWIDPIMGLLELDEPTPESSFTERQKFKGGETQERTEGHD